MTFINPHRLFWYYGVDTLNFELITTILPLPPKSFFSSTIWKLWKLCFLLSLLSPRNFLPLLFPCNLLSFATYARVTDPSPLHHRIADRSLLPTVSSIHPSYATYHHWHWRSSFGMFQVFSLLFSATDGTLVSGPLLEPERPGDLNFVICLFTELPPILCSPPRSDQRSDAIFQQPLYQQGPTSIKLEQYS